ncbi:phage major capsid protein, P2 family [Actinobacillus equuli subsp. haemolyticus]|uniref:Phage major capsid protein, P2 family n=1 Tax=Actinobacillus equuli subsp. equuli TaxID=202947 RepID=A0A9X4G4Q2_ACTEU|nr:phage major capsid protein, P2 family [Actinobacillus equuli]MDE8034655.1 phage major capsid protein, P2 family [Actinobacillus equuli subsp. equuli]MDG4948706.1 phage major capsid protein, P2 family [Actinobacillus equuli subsp. haemolyticus]WGE63800.1 phage major capsid protein, P2 family [Actinobacillus equuli subsp. haemolyticus]
MNEFTLTKLAEYFASVATANAVALSTVENGKKFNVSPTAQQTLETAVLQSSDFLKQINIIPVTEKSGEAVQVGISGPIASRTNTKEKARKTKNPTSLGSNTYDCQKTDFDTNISYDQLDIWAKFPDFAARIGKLKTDRIALDRIMIGFNGIKIAPNTDLDSFPLLQDVNKGWLQHIRERAPARVMKEEKQNSGKIEVGAGKTFKTLDALVFAAKSDLIDEKWREDSKLVAIMGSDLLADKYFPLYNEQKATEQVASDVVISQKRVGGMQAITVPFMPKGTILITRLDNLSIYYQNGAMRRTFKDSPEYDCYEDFLSSNEDYVIQNYECVALLENIKMLDDSTPENPDD